MPMDEITYFGIHQYLMEELERMGIRVYLGRPEIRDNGYRPMSFQERHDRIMLDLIEMGILERPPKYIEEDLRAQRGTVSIDLPIKDLTLY